MPTIRRSSLLVALTLFPACSNGGSSGYDVSSKVTRELPEVVRLALQEAPEVAILSLDPTPRALDAQKWIDRGYDQGEVLDDYAVLGRAVMDPATRLRVVQALYDGMDDNDGTVAACFNPRHGLSATTAGPEPKRVDLVICFECYSFQAFVDGEHAANSLTTDVPQRTFDAALRTANLPVSMR